MTPVRRAAYILLGSMLLVSGYFFSHDAIGTDRVSVALVPGLGGMLAGTGFLIVGMIKGVRFSRTVYIVLGGTMLLSGYYLVYGGIDIVKGGVEMRDVLFSPGIALMGAGMFLIIKTWIVGRW